MAEGAGGWGALEPQPRAPPEVGTRHKSPPAFQLGQRVVPEVESRAVSSVWLTRSLWVQ